MDTTHVMFQVDKTAFSVASLFYKSDENVYWRSKTPYERLQAIELVQRVIYGYKSTTIRFQRLFEVAELKAVEYLLISGYTVGYYGYSRATAGMDIWIVINPNNAKR